VCEYTPGKMMSGMIPAAFLGGSSTLEVLEFRRMIEAPAAELAAKKAAPEDIAALEAIYADMCASTAICSAFSTPIWIFTRRW
jgi:DNA-binding FadR family transcriptional regulator